MEQRHVVSAFHDFVRGVFAGDSVRVSLLRANRARWLRRLAAQRRVTGAEQRWEGEGGSMRQAGIQIRGIEIWGQGRNSFALTHKQNSSPDPGEFQP